MTDSSRRTLLCGAAGLLALAAGCIADDDGESPRSGDDAEHGDDDDDETDTDGSDDNSTGDENAEETESRAFRRTESTSEPNAALFLEREEADEWLAERKIDDEGSVSEFVDGVSFEESSLTALEAGAPNLCYDLVLESAAVEEGRLELEAIVSDEEGDETACAQQETTVGLLVCASDGGEPVREGSATVVDREGDEREFEIGGDGDGEESDSSSDSAAGEETDDDSDTE